MPPLLRGSLLIISLVSLFVKSFLKVFSQAFHSANLVFCGSVIIPHREAKSQRVKACFFAKSQSFGTLPICLARFCWFSRLFARAVYTGCTKGLDQRFFSLLSVLNIFERNQKKSGLWPLQPVEKSALAIRPEQVFCLKTRRQEEKAVKCQAHFRAIWTVCRHPVPDGSHSISRWPAFSDSWQQI